MTEGARPTSWPALFALWRCHDGTLEEEGSIWTPSPIWQTCLKHCFANFSTSSRTCWNSVFTSLTCNSKFKGVTANVCGVVKFKLCKGKTGYLLFYSLTYYSYHAKSIIDVSRRALESGSDACHDGKNTGRRLWYSSGIQSQVPLSDCKPLLCYRCPSPGSPDTSLGFPQSLDKPSHPKPPPERQKPGRSVQMPWFVPPTSFDTCQSLASSLMNSLKKEAFC